MEARHERIDDSEAAEMLESKACLFGDNADGQVDSARQELK